MGGSVWHTFGGIRNGPKGQKISSAIYRVKTRVPILGGSFAIWGTLFSCFDCSISHIRKKV
jgi:import inner membrane translocase subunit TIM17